MINIEDEWWAVITGDIVNFTKLANEDRMALIAHTEKLIKTWVKHPSYAGVFRGDSFQLLLEPERAVTRGVQLICWFKKNSGDVKISARLSVGVGEIAYLGKSVLDSDGEAFHISGRMLDAMSKKDVIQINIAGSALNEQIAVILIFINLVIEAWTPSQAEVVFMAIEGYTQARMAAEIGIHQGAVNKRLKIAKWKAVQEGLDYITRLTRK